MKWRPVDFDLLRNDMIGAAMLTLFGLAAGTWAWWQFEHARQTRENDVLDLNSKVIEVRRLRRDLATVREQYPTYEQLADTGAIGDFNKARELDRFERSLRGHGVSVRGFALGTLQAITLENPGDFERHVPGRYQLTFSAPILHEVQFGQLTDAVRRSLSGLGILESCQLSRDANSVSLDLQAGQAAQLNARCTVAWYVLTPSTPQSLAAGDLTQTEFNQAPDP